MSQRRKFNRRGRCQSYLSPEPYASISSSLLACSAFRQLSGAAMRVLLLFEANFNPNQKATIVPTKEARERLHMSYTTVHRAFEELKEAGFIVLVREPIMPGRMGSMAGGRAAEYDLPHRMNGLSIKIRNIGEPRLDGCWRVHAGKLRALVGQLSDNEAKLYLFFHAAHHSDNGSLADNVPRSLKSAEVGLSKATLHRCLLRLVAVGKIETVSKAEGSKGATYQLSRAEATGVKMKREKMPSTRTAHKTAPSLSV